MATQVGTVTVEGRETEFTRFWGGEERGVCVQVSQGVGHWVQFTEAEARAVGRWMVKWAEEVRSERRRRKARERRAAKRGQR